MRTDSQPLSLLASKAPIMQVQSGCGVQLHTLSSFMQTTFLLIHSVQSCSAFFKVLFVFPSVSWNWGILRNFHLHSLFPLYSLIHGSPRVFSFAYFFCSQDHFTASLPVQHNIHIIIKPTYSSLKKMYHLFQERKQSAQELLVLWHPVIVDLQCPP